MSHTIWLVDWCYRFHFADMVRCSRRNSPYLCPQNTKIHFWDRDRDMVSTGLSTWNAFAVMKIICTPSNPEGVNCFLTRTCKCRYCYVSVSIGQCWQPTFTNTKALFVHTIVNFLFLLVTKRNFTIVRIWNLQTGGFEMFSSKCNFNLDPRLSWSIVKLFLQWCHLFICSVYRNEEPDFGILHSIHCFWLAKYGSAWPDMVPKKLQS